MHLCVCVYVCVLELAYLFLYKANHPAKPSLLHVAHAAALPLQLMLSFFFYLVLYFPFLWLFSG